MKKRLLILFLLLSCFTSKEVNAKHLAGGEVTYTWWKGSYFIIKFNLYRDCSSGNPSLPGTLDYKIFKGSNKSSTFYSGSITPASSAFKKVSPSAPHCVSPTGYCLETCSYIDTVQLGSDTVGYYVAYLAGNMTSAIKNIYDPTNHSEVWNAFIPPVKYHNSSPQFLSSPLPYQCVGKRSYFNQDVSDPDNDSLVMTNVTPYVGSSGLNPTITAPPYTNATYNSGYSATYPFGTIGAPITIDPVTGTLSDSPTTSGYFTVAISFKEYRYDPVLQKSVYLGEIRRQYNYVVNSCATSSNQPPAFASDPLGYTRRIDPDSSVCFKVSGTDPNINDSVFLWATGGIFKNSPNSKMPYAVFPGDTQGKPAGVGKKTTASSTFCWKPDCKQITYTSPYLVTFNLADNNCNVIQRVYKIYVNPRPIFTGPKLYCADVISSSQNKITFKPLSPKAGSFLHYKIYREADSESTYTLIDSISSSSTKTYTDNTVTNANGHAYSYYITATNTCGLEGLPGDTISTLHLNYSILSDKRVNFSWNKQHNNTKIYYRIMVDKGSGFKKLDSTTSLKYSIASCSSSFKLKVQVLSDSGSCASNSNATPTIGLKDATAPNITNKLLNASVTGSNAITISFLPTDSNDISTYYIYRRTTGSYSFVDSVKYTKGITLYNFIDNTVSSLNTTKYYYEVKGKDSCGNVSPGSNMQSAVSLSGKAGELRANLSWAKYQGYTTDTVEVQKQNGALWTTIHYAATTDSTYTDSIGNSCNVIQKYRILVREAGGNSQLSYSNIINVQPVDTIAPAKVDLLDVSVKSSSAITISWNKVADADVKKYTIYYSKNGGTFNLLTTYTIPSGAATSFTYTHTGINTQADTFSYHVFALDSCGPTASKTSETHTAVFLKGYKAPLSSRLEWGYYSGFAVKNYVVQKLVAGSWTTLSTLSSTDTGYTETGLQCGIYYNYRIKAIENGGASQVSYSDSVAVMPYDTTHPTNVDLLSVSVKNGSSIQIKFAKVSNLRVKQYEIDYFINGSSTPTYVATISPPVSNPYIYTQTGLSPTTKTYCYQVFSIDSCGGIKSKLSELHCPVKIGGTAKDNSNLVSWSKYSGFTVDKYYVQRWTGSAWADLTSVNNATTSYLDTGLSCKVVKYYRIRTTDSATTEQSYSDSIALDPYDTVSPKQVDMINASVKGNNSVVIQFKKVPDKDVKKYYIYSSVNGGIFNLLDSVKTVFAGTYSYTQSGINPVLNTYSYKVVAIDSCGSNNSKSSETHTTIKLGGTAKDLSTLLNWTKYAGFAVDSYIVQRWNGKAWNSIKALDSSKKSYVDTPLACTVLQYYRIKAIEKAGAGAYSYSDTIPLTPFDTIRPDNPFIHYVSMPDDSTVYISWNKVKANDVKQYILFRKGPTASVFTAFDTVTTDTFYTDKFAAPLTGSWCYKVMAMDSCANNLSAASIPHCTIFPALSILGCKQQIIVKWNPYVNWKNPLSNYKVYRRINEGVESLLATVAATIDTFTDNSGIDFRYKYRYRIEANEKNTLAISSSKTILGQTFQAQTPSILYATKKITSATSGQVVIKWAAQNTASSPHIKYHSLYYKQSGAAGAFTLLSGNMPVSQDSFVQNSLNTNTKDYEYYVYATDSCGNISDTSTIHKTMELKMTIGQLVHRLTWTPYEGWPVKRYVVQLLLGKTWTNFDTVAGTATTYQRFPAPCNKAVYYRIQAQDSTTNLALSDSAGGQAIDTQPPNKAIFKNATVLNGTSASLSFRGSDSTDMYKYAIMRSNDSGTIYNTAGSMLFTTPGAALSFTDKVNTLNDYHRYVVVALDSCLNATPSDTFATIQLRGSAQNLQNRLFWRPFKGYPVDSYYIQIFSGGTWSSLATVKGTDSFYVHTSLNCNVPRTYRLYANEKGGARSTQSDSITLTPFDKIAPPAPATDYATIKPGNSSIYYQWQKAVAKVKLYEVSLKSANGPWAVITTLTNKLNYTFTGLDTKDSVYSMRVVAIDSCAANRSAASTTQSTINLKGTALNLAGKLDWTSYQGFTVQKYYIYRQSGATWSKIDSVSSGTNTYTDAPLACKLRQHYMIGAMDNTGKFISNSDSISLVPFDTLKPAATSINYATVLPNHNIKISYKWNLASNVKYFEIWRKKDAGAFALLKTVTFDSSYTDATADARYSSYSYYVIVVDSCSSLNRSLPSDTDKVMNLSSHTGGCKPYASIYWTPYTNLPNGTSSYVIYKSSGAGFNKLTSLSGSATSFTDTSVIENNNYCYKVVAYDSKSGYSSSSDSICVTPFIFPRPKTISVKVASVVKSGIASGSIKIDWSRRVKGDTFAVAYRLYHSTSAAGPFTLIHQENDTNITSFLHSGINTLKAAHFYYVVTVNTCNLESFPLDTHKTVDLGYVNKNLEVDLNWNTYKGFAIGSYEIYRSINGGAYYLLATKTATDSTLQDLNIRCGLTYSYRIKALGATYAKIASWSDSVTTTGKDTIPPKGAEILSASVISTDAKIGTIDLNFNSANDINRKGYKVYRMDGGSGYFNILRTVSDTQSNNILITDNKLNTYRSTYSYYVQTFDSCGNTGMVSDTHTVMMLAAMPVNGKNQVQWSSYIGFDAYTYKLERMTPTTGWRTMATLSSRNNYFEDSLITCHVKYTYRITAIETGTKNTSYSNIDTATGIRNTPPVHPQLIRATVVTTDKLAGSMLIQWHPSATYGIANYYIYRSAEGISWVKIATLPGIDTSYSDNSLNTYRQDYFYRIEAIDSCGNTSSDKNLINTHHTIGFTANAGNQETDIKWNNYTGFPIAKYRLYRDGALWHNFSDTATTYVDTLVICGRMYHYVLKAIGTDSNLVSWSGRDSVITIDHIPPRAIHLYTATVDYPNISIMVKWTKSTNYDALKYLVYRRNGEIANYKLIRSVTNLSDTSFVDSLGSLNPGSYCYYVQVADYCNNKSAPSNDGCTIYLTGTIAPLEHTLNWTPYKAWGKGIDHYNIYKKEDSAGWNLIGSVGGKERSFKDVNLDNFVRDHCYRVEAVELAGYKASSKSNMVCLQQPAIIYMPNAFSPGSTPGVNDIFGPKGTYFGDYEMRIYDRWGELIYSTTTGKAWDGKAIGGDIATEGVYIYEVMVPNYDGKKKHYFNGSVQIVK
jgi:hypothetical protein